MDRHDLLSQVDSVRYATTLGTNALIERKGPQIGAIVSAGFEATIPLSRGRGYRERLDELAKNDLSNGTRPDPLVPQRLIRSVRERVDYRGQVFMALDQDDVRRQLRELVDAGAQALVVCLVNAVENPEHELRVQEIFLEEYPAHQLGAIPMLLSHQLSGRKGEYVRGTSTIIDAFSTRRCITPCRSSSRTSGTTVTRNRCLSFTTPAGWRSSTRPTPCRRFTRVPSPGSRPASTWPNRRSSGN